MKKLVPGYYQPTDEEFKRLWNECMFVFDASMLLLQRIHQSLPIHFLIIVSVDARSLLSNPMLSPWPVATAPGSDFALIV